MPSTRKPKTEDETTSGPELFQHKDFIAVYDRALQSDLCCELVANFEDSNRKMPGRTGYGVDRSKKYSSDITLNAYPEWHDCLKHIVRASQPCIRDYFCRYLFALIGAMSPTVRHPGNGAPTPLCLENWKEVGLPLADEIIATIFRSGSVNIQKYEAGVGNYLHWHSEIYPQEHSVEALSRVLLFMFYLNDVVDGGETEFYYQRLAIKPRQGRMVIAPAGFTHTHRGCIPRSGPKYIATSWVLFRSVNQLVAHLSTSPPREPLARRR